MQDNNPSAFPPPVVPRPAADGGDLDTARRLLQEGRLTEAQALADRLCVGEPQRPTHWSLLGAIEGRLNRLPQAAACFRKALALDPHDAAHHFNLGKALELQECYADAEQAYREALVCQPDMALAHMRLGNALLAQDRVPEAIASYRQAVALAPELAAARSNLGAAQLRAGDPAAAEESVAAAIVLDPRLSEAHHGMGDLLRSMGRFDAARESYERALAYGPPLARTHNNLGCLLFDQYRLDEAAAQFRAAIGILPSLVDAHVNLANTLQEQGWRDQAIAACREALRFNSAYSAAYVTLGQLYLSMGEMEAALSCFRRAVNLEPDNRKCIAGLAGAYEMQGDWRQAWQLLQPLVGDAHPSPEVAGVFAPLCKRLDRCDEAVGMIERLLQESTVNSAQRASLLFKLANAYDDLQRYDLAFARAQEANASKRRRFDIGAHKKLIDGLIAAFPPAGPSGVPQAAVRSPRPVFIVGMPRSGTSLVEQILARHPAVHGGGELPDLGAAAARLEGLTNTAYPQAIAAMTRAQCEDIAGRYHERLQTLAGGAVCVTDKMPINFLHLGLISGMLPDARIIHCVRDPRDTCLSCYFHDFLGRENYFSYDLTMLGEYYGHYRRLMTHWGRVLPMPLLEVRYEDLVADQERVSRAMVEFCGLEWDERCLSFHESPRTVATVSYNQVRQPIYRGSVGRWHHYADHLQPLLAALGEWGRD